jgi:glycosyltransferase involved in cell wall biosynthesis
MLLVLSTIAGLSPEYGGPARSLPTLVEALTRLGVQTELITCASHAGAPAPLLPAPDLVRSHVLPWRCRSRDWIARNNEFFKTIGHLVQMAGRTEKASILHDTGLWLPSNHAVAAAARRFGLPLIVSPRGMLTPWALKYRGLKKRIAWALYQRRDLQSAEVLHATSLQEARDLRALGLRQPIAVIPNGVELPPLRSPLAPQPCSPPHLPVDTPLAASRALLFLGRIHPVKGLMHLVEAWPVALKAAGTPRGQWKVIIAGNDEGGYQAGLQKAIRLRGVEADFEFVGPIEGQAKWALYRRADLFVLPSHSENFGLVVAEALACGVPVITTRGTPWQELEAQGCGWWVEIGAKPLAAALREALALPEQQLQEMGQRGRRLIESKYTWPRAAEQMKLVYEWVLRLGPKPGSIFEE